MNEIKIIDLSKIDLERIYEICSGNPEYYQHMNEQLNREKLQKLMVALPPEADLKNKRNIGFTINGHLIGYLEMIEHYPDSETALIGFFIIDKLFQGKGIGSLIIDNPNRG